jgi:glycosyltransferase involved in cell wall biosynthesis
MFSVLLPIYLRDDPNLLSLAIKSIWDDQLLKPGEIVVVIDGPITDILRCIISKWSKKIGDKFKIITIETNIGLGGALNIGMKHCSFELLARMDADDISLPDRFERQFRVFEENPLFDIVGGAAIEINEYGHEVGLRKMPVLHQDILSAIWAAPIIHPSVMFKKDAILKIGGYDYSLIRRQDYELWFRCAKNNLIFHNIEEPVLKYRFTRSTHAKQPVKLAFSQAIIGFKGSSDLDLALWKRFACFYPFLRSLMPLSIQILLYRILGVLDPRKRNHNN